jgi:hypothetical protein
MKQFCKIAVLALLFVGLSNVNAQDANNPWQISVGINAVDVYPTNSERASQLPAYQTGKMFSEFLSIKEHWNMVPSVSYVHVSKYIGDGFSAGVRGSINAISKLGNSSVTDLAYYSIDGTIKYNLNDGTKLQPFAEFGGGYTWVDGIGAGTVNGGLGLNYWFSDMFGLTLQTQYKHAFETYGMTHFQHSAGISIRFGGSDTDDSGM